MAHQDWRNQKVTSAPGSQTIKNDFNSRLNCPKSISGCRRVLDRLFRTRGSATLLSLNRVTTGLFDSGRCRRWCWQNEDDSAQHRWRWAGIFLLQVWRGYFGPAATWIPERPALFITLHHMEKTDAGPVASESEK